jgi:hypothetical protein
MIRKRIVDKILEKKSFANHIDFRKYGEILYLNIPPVRSQTRT